MRPQKIEVPDGYQYAVHLIFAIIIASSFELASEILIPLDGAFTDKNNLVLASSLLLSYVVIIAGWVGYALSMSTKPHKDNYKGALRFMIDLIIPFENFYLIQLVPTEKFILEFPIVLSVLFTTYIIWDVIKYFEYHSKEARKITKNRGGRTGVCAIFCYILTVAYLLTSSDPNSEFYLFADDQSHALVFTFLMLFLIIFYRIWKWDIRCRKQPAKKRVNKKNNSN